jgi:hypothetical protein
VKANNVEEEKIIVTVKFILIQCFDNIFWPLARVFVPVVGVVVLILFFGVVRAILLKVYFHVGHSDCVVLSWAFFFILLFLANSPVKSLLPLF